MVKQHNNTLQEIKKNLELFKHKIIDKNLNDNFWIIADRADFKPLQKTIIIKKKEIKTNIHSIKEIRDCILNDKGEYYKDKKFACIKITLNDKTIDLISDIKQYKNIKNKIILDIQIIIFLISPTGFINFTNKWELRVKYFIDDFRTLNFKLKNIEVLMRLVADNVVTSDSINGISYSDLLEKINKKND